MFFEIVLVIAAAAFLHTWAGYPLILFILTRLKKTEKRPSAATGVLPTVSVIVPAYNTSKKIKDKLADVLALDYPSEKMEIIVVSDGSTDDTVRQAGSVAAPNIRVFALDRNQGKSAAQNFGIARAHGEIVVFTDIDARLEKSFIRNIIPHFSDPRVACVGGRGVLISEDGTISRSLGLYWKIEQFLRSSESGLGMLHSLPGWGFAVRRSDFIPLDTDTGDDMIIPLDMALIRKISVFAPDALVSDSMPSSLRGEIKARQRITLRNLRGVSKRWRLLVPWLYPRMSFALWSHKVLRWMSPVLLLIILASSAWLAADRGTWFYRSLLLVQVFGYGIGAAGVFGNSKGVRIPVGGHLSSFLIANIGFFIGILRFAGGHRIRSYSNVDSLTEGVERE